MTDIIVFAGQSNMQGQSEKLLDGAAVPDAFEYKYATDSLVPLCDPFGEDLRYDGTAGVAYGDGTEDGWHRLHVLGGAAYGHTTLVPAFCRVYTGSTGRRVVAVGAAKGAVTIDYFMRGSDGFDFLVRKTNAAKKHVTDPSGSVFLVWLQGESDAIDSTGKDEYLERIGRMSRDLKAEIGLEKFCVIRVGRFTNDERDDEIIAAQDEICARDPLFLMLTDEATELNGIPEYMNPGVSGHFSAEGLRKLGSDAAAALSEYVLSVQRG
ncbi:MAG: hypothetical protein IJM71_03220 [Clostridia bacterium]|nr:hypothetical protein [Clostridia bacterium]